MGYKQNQPSGGVFKKGQSWTKHVETFLGFGTVFVHHN